MKNTKKLLLTITAAIVVFSMGVGAATTSTAIKAALNKVLTITVDGEAFQPKDSKGNRLYPIVYNGVTYVPVTAFANELGAESKYSTKAYGTIEVSSGVDSTPIEDINSSGGSTSSNSNTSNNSNPSNSASSGLKLENVSYDASKRSTWLKFTGIRVEAKTTSDGKKYFLATMDVTNRSDSTVELKSYGDTILKDENEEWLDVAILTGVTAKATLKPGDSATVVKGFFASSADELSFVIYSPLTAPRGDSAKVYIKK